MEGPAWISWEGIVSEPDPSQPDPHTRQKLIQHPLHELQKFVSQVGWTLVIGLRAHPPRHQSLWNLAQWYHSGHWTPYPKLLLGLQGQKLARRWHCYLHPWLRPFQDHLQSFPDRTGHPWTISLASSSHLCHFLSPTVFRHICFTSPWRFIDALPPAKSNSLLLVRDFNIDASQVNSHPVLSSLQAKHNCRKLSPSPPEVLNHRNPPLTTFTLLTLYLSLTLSFLPSLHLTTLVFFSPSPTSSLCLPLRAAGKCGYTSKPTSKQPTMNSAPTISTNLCWLCLGRLVQQLHVCDVQDHTVQAKEARKQPPLPVTWLTQTYPQEEPPPQTKPGPNSRLWETTLPLPSEQHVLTFSLHWHQTSNSPVTSGNPSTRSLQS